MVVCVAPCALCSAVVRVALCDGRCLLPTQDFPRSAVPWQPLLLVDVGVARPAFASYLWPSLVFWGHHSGTGKDDVLLLSQFLAFPTRQGRLLVGRQG